ncbi:MAG: XRE family transcriptional regulator [Solobacterium sp.]|nr:XRE family transcriptional regulator [Solobacterium sp.]
MSIGENIKRRRQELGLTQQDLADALGYKTRSTITKIESGENDVTQKKLMKIAEVLNTSVESLFADSTFFPTTSKNDAAYSLSITTPTKANDEQKNVVILLAGGQSVRNHYNIPNQFINILGKPVIIYCLEAYQAHPAIDDIYVVCLQGWEKIVQSYAEQYHITKLRGVIQAASSGILSLKNGINRIKDIYNPKDIIIIQESNRPMITVDMISKLLQATYEHDCATISQNTKDKVHFIFQNQKAEYVDRNTLIELQSPEAYRLSMIQKVFDTAQEKKHSLDESCFTMLVYNMNYPINFIEGPLSNIKIVRQEDIKIFETLLKNL